MKTIKSKNLVILIAIVIIPCLTFSQDIAGSWKWKSENGSNSFKLSLILKDGEFKGYHCGIFYNGEKIDCALEEYGTFSVELKRISQGVFEGSIESAFSGVKAEVKITYNSTDDTLIFNITKEPNEEYYFPDECILKKY